MLRVLNNALVLCLLSKDKQGQSENRVKSLSISLSISEGINHPLPTPNEIAKSIPHCSKVFFILDGVKGYWQVPIDESSRSFTTFLTNWEGEIYKSPYGSQRVGRRLLLEGRHCIKRK
ncbi:unnamed protein product [Lepeophtheirus salmonis]|uniref:(salmon louse) hypothetical protein n=1 Tax=Lepeophtheirus salmonis TaxID=72036 RepID=A0A817FEZ8_LEPSM|nr:unnamed protein product [Lepeophtheirus salmonis]CAG9478492.1 unnamed protein product [Lepeophtheirus salmonis]